jgi:hypothetical protein
MADKEPASVTQLVELRVTRRYAQAHGWVVNALTGWLSAYYMEDARFRVRRHHEELETGMHVWLCELEEGMSMKRLLRRLQADLPPYQVNEQGPLPEGSHGRYIIDLPG